jgi:DNA-binding MarR family transcriptional regulator
MNNNLNLLFAVARTNAVMARRLAGHGLDFSDFMILSHLSQADGKKLRRIDLAHKLGLTASGITRILLPLEKLGIIARDQGEDDARARYATLTKAGQQLLDDASATMEMRLEDVFPDGETKQANNATAILEMATENMLQPEYQQESKVRWSSTDAYKQSTERVKKMKKEDLQRIKEEGEALTHRIANAMSLSPDDNKVQALIAEHYANLRHFYEPDIEMYRGLGQMYVDDGRFGAYYEKFAPGLAKFMSDAINAFCDKHK